MRRRAESFFEVSGKQASEEGIKRQGRMPEETPLTCLVHVRAEARNHNEYRNADPLNWEF